jgi:hypothetical protein
MEPRLAELGPIQFGRVAVPDGGEVAQVGKGEHVAPVAAEARVDDAEQAGVPTDPEMLPVTRDPVLGGESEGERTHLAGHHVRARVRC